MAVDVEHLRRHYASLSDEALLEIEPGDLVEAARKCYDEEVARRKPAAVRRAVPAPGPSGAAAPPGEGDDPNWLEDASEVCSYAVMGADPSPAAANARDALHAAGIPCHLELSEIPPEKSRHPDPTHVWRLLAPGKLNMRAASILERDVFNPEFEAQWRTHLETLSDDDVLGMDPRTAFCGLFDRLERVEGAYHDELVRRGLAEDDEDAG